MTGPWGGPRPDGEPGSPHGLQPPAPGSEPGDRLPGPYGGPPRDGGVPDGEPGRPAPLPDGEPGVPAHREPPREQHDRAGGLGGAGGPAPGGAAPAPGHGADAEPPEDVRTAWVLWLAATAFALVGMWINALTAQLSDLPQATRDAIRDAAGQAGDDAGTMEGVFTAAMVLGAALAVVAAAVTVWLAFRMRAGRGWARTLLDIVAVFLVVDAVAVLVGVFTGSITTGARGEMTTFVVMCLQILAGLCAGVAVWRQHSADSHGHFAAPGPRRGDARPGGGPRVRD